MVIIRDKIKELESKLQIQENEVVITRKVINALQDIINEQELTHLPAPEKDTSCKKKYKQHKARAKTVNVIKSEGKRKPVNIEKGIRKTPAGKFEASYYVKGIGMKYIGTFDTLEEARQARYDYAEQLENNPDRQEVKKIGKFDASYYTKGEKVFECRKCHVSYQTKPKVCPGCNGDKFAEVYE